MRFGHIDWDGDGLYIIGFILLLVVVMVLLERVAPTRQRFGKRDYRRRRDDSDLI